MILANCRAKLTADDFDFIVRVMEQRGARRVTIQELLCDESCRDCLLDDDAVCQAIMDSPETLQISPNLLFYVMCRKVLKGTPASARDTADYLASMLNKFLLARRLTAPEELSGQDLRYVCDALVKIADAPPAQAFILRAHLGNYTLFLTGLFHEHIEKRMRHGGPSLNYYEEVGRGSFAVAAKSSEAHRLGLDQIFATLGECFHEVRIALSDLAGRLLHLNSSPEPALVAAA